MHAAGISGFSGTPDPHNHAGSAQASGREWAGQATAHSGQSAPTEWPTRVSAQPAQLLVSSRPNGQITRFREGRARLPRVKNKSITRLGANRTGILKPLMRRTNRTGGGAALPHPSGTRPK